VVTIADVAARAGVSIATVSRVLSPGAAPHPVSADTAERVRAAARELSFVPSAMAQGLVVRRSGLIGLVVPDLLDPYYPSIASGVEQAARKSQHAVLICNTLGTESRLRDYVRLLRARRVEAIVVSGGSTLRDRQLRLLERSDVPVVLIGRPVEDGGLTYVSIDNMAAARAATEHLIQIGRTRIAHLSGATTQRTMHDRADGFFAAVRIPSIEGRLEALLLETSGAPEHGYSVVAEQLAKGPRADGIFAATDRLAIAAMAAVHDAGLQVPQDVAVIGFDDIPLAGLLRPSLSSVAQPAVQLGKEAIRLALQLAAGQRAQSVVLPARPIFRASTQP
jgi:LacI family transcriptional regulator